MKKYFKIIYEEMNLIVLAQINPLKIEKIAIEGDQTVDPEDLDGCVLEQLHLEVKKQLEISAIENS